MGTKAIPGPTWNPMVATLVFAFPMHAAPRAVQPVVQAIRVELAATGQALVDAERIVAIFHVAPLWQLGHCFTFRSALFASASVV